MIKSSIKGAFESLGYSLTKVPVRENKMTYLTHLFGADFRPKDFDFCFEGFEFIKNLKEKSSARFYLYNNTVRIDIAGLTYGINTWEELYILNEVFFEGCYNFQGKKEFLLVDIGMNVGITSLLFSSNPLCKQVVSFEPFQKTLDRAKLNFLLNKTSRKIKVHEVGLGYPGRKIQVEYSDQYKGTVGIKGVAGLNVQSTAELKIVDVYEALKDVLTTDLDVVIKIDCEGAEYEIIDRLNDTNLLNKASFYMIEWHKEGASKLKEIFLKNNFNILSFKDDETIIGMFYAYKCG